MTNLRKRPYRAVILGNRPGH